MKHFTFFLFQKITMFHFACGLLIINEDVQYALQELFFLPGDFRPLQAPINTTSNTMHSSYIPVGMLVMWFTHVLTTWGSIPGLALVVVFRRLIIALSIA